MSHSVRLASLNIDLLQAEDVGDFPESPLAYQTPSANFLAMGTKPPTRPRQRATILAESHHFGV